MVAEVPTTAPPFSSSIAPDTTPTTSERTPMTFIWFVIWLIANNVGGREPLIFDPVNAWTGTLILAIALDLGASHAGGTRKGRAA
jgi:hypothetical protein